jgi:2-methylcitrate dehydratase PrpD
MLDTSTRLSENSYSPETDSNNLAGLTEHVAQFIAHSRFEDLPDAAICEAKVAILDCIGVTVAGVATPTGQVINRVVEAIGSTPVATVIGSGVATDPANAALANGTTGHALDFDDVNWTMIAHPTVAILPAVLALAEARGATGRDVLLAYIVGFEIGSKLGGAVHPRHYEHGWHATGTLGTIGAAAAAARLIGLDAERTRHALGIAASSAAGVRQNFGTDTKPFHAGNAARAGVLAAQLAEAGFKADQNIFESQWGIFNVFSAPGHFHPEFLQHRLGAPWDIVEPGVLVKMYPSCVSTHTSIDAMLGLCNEHDIRPDDVDSVDVGVVYLSTKMLIHDRPTHGLQGKFSMPYCMARAMLDRAVVLDDFTDEAVMQPDAQALLRRVTMRIEPAVSDGWRPGLPRPAIVSVTMKDGRVLRRRVDNPSGNAGNLDTDLLYEKFRHCAQWLGADQARYAEAMLRDLENVGEIGDLMKWLKGVRYESVGIRY